MDYSRLITSIAVCLCLVLLVGCGSTPAATPDAVPATASDVEPPPPGIISGGLCFPSDYIPPMTLYARNVDTQQTFSIQVPVDTAEYRMEIPVEGTYVVFAWTDSGFGGSYSQFVPCGLSVECTDHSLIPIPVRPGATVTGIDVCDFYSEESVPKP
jgi:hypothetical protein